MCMHGDLSGNIFILNSIKELRGKVRKHKNIWAVSVLKAALNKNIYV